MEMNQLTDPAYYIMLSVLEAKHGYAIMKYIEELTNGDFTIGPATLYTLLKKLQNAGFIVQDETDDDRRKTYTATEKGKALLCSEIKRRKQMVEHGIEAFKSLKGAGEHDMER
ncbi:PadR family transcriptional regulator [Bacillus shackletonii]|nr:PadR family transcriptional regulator [Heyndrickxia shackletonii]NEZ01536.1 PadR family transcriptional regulator [Heyndrickxia shackletonii]